MEKRINILHFLLIVMCLGVTTATSKHNDVKKIAVFVLGMHRSGTSATAGTLSTLGLYFGTNLLGKANTNPKGHFEDIDTMRLNKAFLERIGTTWYDLAPLKINWQSNQVKEFKQKIKTAWSAELLTHNFFGVKEPNMCLLLPIYVELAQESGYEVKVILVHRDFREIATSLSNRARKLKMTWEHAFKLADKYITTLNQYLAPLNLPTLAITFDQLVNNTAEVVSQIDAFLPMLNIDEAKKTLACEFIDKDLKHHSIQANS